MPLVPNWVFNVAAPWVGVPVPLFAVAVFFGQLPYTFVCARAGNLVNGFHSLSDAVQWHVVAQLSVLAALAMVPVAFAGRCSRHFHAHADADDGEKYSRSVLV
jgi:uncharacterized membrane protein YdjX (TVP38/TMEM64 family)